MANTEQILKTKIRLRYDSFEHWSKCTEALLEGEIAVAYLGPTKTTTSPDNGTHPVMFKVGPGLFNDLPWASALAADVYAWAKNPNKPTYDADEIKVDTTGNHFNGKGLDAALAEIWSEIIALTGGEEGAGAIADQIQAGIKAIQGATATAGNYVTGVSIDENGNLKLSEAALPASATPEQGNKADSAIQTLNILGKALNKDTNTLSVDEAKTALGLGSAAYTNSTAYATNTQGEKADSAIQGVKVNGVALTPDNDKIVDITVPTEAQIKNIAATEINTLIDGANSEDTITNINTLISYVNENGADTSAIMSELYGDDATESRIDKLEARSGLDKVGTVTKVSAGNGLTGGDITETGTIALDDNYVKTIKVNEAGKADQATNAENAAKATNADSAADSNKLNGQTADFYLAKTEATGWNDILTKTEATTTINQANTALQTIEAGTGLKVSEKANNKQTISIDEEVVFILWGGDAEGWTVNHDGNA